MSRKYLLLAAALFGAPAAGPAIDPAAATPPTAKKVPYTHELHGDKRPDDFFWLKDKKNPDVIKYLEDENAYFAAVMKPTEKFQEALYKEFLSRITQTD